MPAKDEIVENKAVDVCNMMLETANRLPTLEEMWQAGYNDAEEKFSAPNKRMAGAKPPQIKPHSCRPPFCTRGLSYCCGKGGDCA